MRAPKGREPPDFEVRFSEPFKRRKHRRDTSTFFWGTWLMLFLAIGLGYETLQGFRSGEWIDISSDDSGLLVPWWLAAALACGVLMLSLWCFGRYLKLKDTAPTYQPGDEQDSDE